MFEIRVPASSSNLGAGFDALSLALKLYLRLRIEPGVGSGQHFRSTEEFQFEIGENYVARAATETALRYGSRLPPYRATLLEGIPVGRGLGSSAAALVAGIRVAERICGLKISAGEAVELATELEGHPDNVTAALFGGLVLSAQDEERVLCKRFVLSKDLRFVAVIPDFQLPTQKARGVLPATYSRADVTHNVQRAALLAALLATGDFPFDREILADRVHQPFRAALVPGFSDLLRLEVEGLVGVTLSGAGPTVLLWCRDNHDNAGAAAVEAFQKHGVRAEYRVLEVDNSGTQFEDRNHEPAE